MELNQAEKGFLTQTLGSSNFESFRLAGDASTRKYYRIVMDDETWALMAWDPFDEKSEYPFLNILNHFKKSGILVPEVKACDGSKGLILLEDLGDLTLERKFWENQDQSLVLPFYKKTIEQLALIHTTATKSVDPKPVCQKVAFDQEKFLWELNYAKTHLVEGLCEVKLPASFSRELEACFSNLADVLAKEPKVVCHRDYHSRNVMLKLGKTYVIDFQDARLGPRQYDLVSLLYDSYVDLDDSIRSLLLDEYIGRLPKTEQDLCCTDHFSEIMSLQIVQRCFKACGSFASFYQTRKDTRYLKYIAPTLRTVFAEASRVPWLKPLTQLTTDEGLLERCFDDLCEP